MPALVLDASALTSFSVTRLRQANRYQAARYAVLDPLQGNKDWAKTKDDVVTIMAWLRDTWRERLVRLSKQGAPWLNTATRLHFAANCPPFGVEFSVPFRTCNRRMICPHCYGRRVIDAYVHLETFLFGGTHPQAKPKLGFTAVGFRVTNRVMPKDQPFTLETIREYLVPKALSYYRQTRHAEFQFFGRPAVAVTMCHIVPSVADNSLKIHRCGVLLLKSERLRDDNPPGNKKHGKYRRRVEPNKKQLARLLAWALAYPRAHFFQPAYAVTTVAASLQRRRLFAKHGG